MSPNFDVNKAKAEFATLPKHKHRPTAGGLCPMCEAMAVIESFGPKGVA